MVSYNYVTVLLRKLVNHHNAMVEASSLAKNNNQHELTAHIKGVTLDREKLLSDLAWIKAAHKKLKVDSFFDDEELKLTISGPIDESTQLKLQNAHDYLQHRIEKQKKREVE